MTDHLHSPDFKQHHLALALARLDRQRAAAQALGLGPAPFGNFLGLRLAARDAFHFAALVLDHDPDLHLKLKAAAASDPDFLAARAALPRRDSMAA